MANKFDKILGEYRENDADGIITDHTALSNIGTNTHPQIDTHLSATGSQAHGIVIYYPSTLTVDYGTLTSGVVGDLDDSGVNIVTITEVATANALQVELDFTGITAFTALVAYCRYTGFTAHQIAWEIYNVGTSSWEQIGTTTHSTSYSWHTFGIVNFANYISAGAVRIRARHLQTGTPGHTLLLDYVSLRDGGATGGGVTEHGSLLGLTDDDHTQYVLKSGSLTQLTTRSHTDLTDIGTNTHTQIDTHLGAPINVSSNTTDLGPNGTSARAFDTDYTNTDTYSKIIFVSIECTNNDLANSRRLGAQLIFSGTVISTNQGISLPDNSIQLSFFGIITPDIVYSIATLADPDYNYACLGWYEWPLLHT